MTILRKLTVGLMVQTRPAWFLGRMVLGMFLVILETGKCAIVVLDEIFVPVDLLCPILVIQLAQFSAFQTNYARNNLTYLVILNKLFSGTLVNVEEGS